MTLGMNISKLFRGTEVGKLGKALFVFGGGLLSFSSVCMMRNGEDPYLEIQGPVLILFGAAVVFILGGESIRGLARYREQRFAPRLIQYLHVPKPAPRAEKNLDVRCFFCGKTVAGSASKQGRVQTANLASQFGRCLNCGKTICPRCSYLKGLEMDRKSLRCPGCGGPVY